jgi:ribosomal protein S12 methylthiotransferase
MSRKRNLCVVSLGCPKNLVDTETMVGQAIPRGFDLVAEPEEADAILINTCSFIQPSRDESVATIEDYLDFKRHGKARAVVVAGCMAQSHREELESRFPDVDAFLDFEGEKTVGETLVRLMARGKKSKKKKPTPAEKLPPYFRMVLTPPHTAYLRISDGCDHICSFCIIPQIRGPHQSRTMEEVVAEANDLVVEGVREINLIAQDSSAYGLDIYGERKLDQLLRQLNEVEGIDWIRVMYAYPTEVTDRLIETMAELPRVVKYIDLPLQHASPKVLQAMKRPHTPKYLEELIEKIRKAMPGVSLRSTFITGFPGETEEDFQMLLDFCRRMQFEHAGCFIYSHEERSTSAHLPNPVSPEVQQERYERLVKVLTEASEKQIARRVGSETDVLIDGPSGIFPDFVRGRHSGQAPDIDGVVYVPAEAAEPGEMVRVSLTAAKGYDLFSEPVTE